MGDRYAGFALALNERLVAVENLLHRCSRHTHLTDAARCRPRTTAGVVEKVINEVTRAADIEASKEIFSDIYSKGSTALEKATLELESLYPAVKVEEGAKAEWQAAMAALQTIVIVRMLNKPSPEAEERQQLLTAFYGLPANAATDAGAEAIAEIQELSSKLLTLPARNPLDPKTTVLGIQLDGKAVTVVTLEKGYYLGTLQRSALEWLRKLRARAPSLPQLGGKVKFGPELFSSEPRMLKRTLSTALRKCDALLATVEHTEVRFGTEYSEQETCTMQVFLPGSHAEAYKEQTQAKWKEEKKLEVVVRDKTDWHDLTDGKGRAPKKKPRGKGSKKSLQAEDTESHLTEISSIRNAAIQEMDWPMILKRYFEMEKRKEPFPFHELELRKISEKDVRIWKRGIDGVFVRPGYNIPARTCLGPYVTRVCFDAEHNEILMSGQGHVREPYLHEFGTSDDWGEIYDEHRNRKLNTMVGDAYVCGNILRNISDCRADPIKHPLGSDGDKKNNCLFVEVLHHGWPYVFVVTTEAIAGGQEIMMDHTNAFWEEYVQGGMNVDFHQQVAKRLKGSLHKIRSAKSKLVQQYPELEGLGSEPEDDEDDEDKGGDGDGDGGAAYEGGGGPA